MEYFEIVLVIDSEYKYKLIIGHIRIGIDYYWLMKGITAHPTNETIWGGTRNAGGVNADASRKLQ